MSGAPAAVDASPADPADAGRSLVAPPLVRRMASFLYEGVLLFGVLFATGLVYGILVRQTNGLQNRTGLIATCFVVLGLYFVGLWTRSGQTLAMKTWHLRLVADDGAPLSARRALARYLAAWIWFVPSLLLAGSLAHPSVTTDSLIPIAWVLLYALSSRLHPRRQFWHDALCGTAIVGARATRPLPE